MGGRGAGWGPTLNHTATVVLNGRIVHEVHQQYPGNTYLGYQNGAVSADEWRRRFRAGNAAREDVEGRPGSTAFAVGGHLITLEFPTDHEHDRAMRDLFDGRVPYIGGVRRDIADVVILPGDVRHGKVAAPAAGPSTFDQPAAQSAPMASLAAAAGPQATPPSPRSQDHRMRCCRCASRSRTATSSGTAGTRCGS
ncbi:hypothetical protein ACFQZ4_42455 [Catellatospora coxensis]